MRQTLIEVVKQFNTNSLISTHDQNEIIDKIQSKKFIKIVLETIYNRNTNNEIVFGFIGFLNLPDKKGTLFHAFSVFHFVNSTTLTLKRSSDCIMWGIICKYSYYTFESKQGKTEQLAMKNSVIEYMKNTTMKSFVKDKKEYFEKMKDEAEKYTTFLQENTKDELKKIEQNSQYRPDTVVPNDPLDLNSFY